MRQQITPLAPIMSCDISGQCRACLDLFSISVFAYHGHAMIVETPRVVWQWIAESEGMPVRPRLVHRPDICNGEIKLYGSLELLNITTGITPPRRPVFGAAEETTPWRELDASRI